MAATKKAPDPTTYIQENYGFLAGFLAIPEIKKILLNAAKGEWAPAKLQGAVYATKWWKQTAETTRAWIALQSTDPATARQRLTATKTQISAAAKAAGIAVSEQQLNAWALNVNKFGWTEQQVQSAIGHQFKYNPNKAATGQAQLTVDAIKAKAAEYLVPMSNATIQKWAQDVVGGTVDLAAFDSYAKEQAKSLFPGLAAALDSGVTVAQYVNPYKQVAAQTLEIPEEQVNFMDPKWRKAVDQIDPKTGLRTSMSLSDWQTELRKNKIYGWDTTTQAREQAADFASKISARFGML